MALLFRRFGKLVLILKGSVGFVPKKILTAPSLGAPAVLGFVELDGDPKREHEDENTRKLAKGSTPDILLNPERPKDLTSRREQNSPDIAHNAPKPGSADPGDGFHEPERRAPVSQHKCNISIAYTWIGKVKRILSGLFT